MENVELKNKWIKARNTNTVDVQILYEFAIHSGSVITPQEFEIGLRFQPADFFIDFVDHYFGVTILFNNKNQFLKIIE